MIRKVFFSVLASSLLFVSCNKDDDNNPTPIPISGVDPDAAPKVSVDRFSADAGTLMVRNASNGLPEANAPINFDSGAPFITQGLTAAGNVVYYYNFDVQGTEPAPIYVFFRTDDSQVAGQLNVIDVIPGDEGYNDFWQVHRVIVPDTYVANTVTSYDEIQAQGFTVEETMTLVNCPVVPEGSTASKRVSGDAGLVRGWYKNEIAYYFAFTEKELSGDQVPLSPIYVTFNVNPDDANPDSGPASGFMTDGDTQTHNVIATIPADAAYSPLWSVNVYNNEDFYDVSDLATAVSSNILANGVATVNCPVVEISDSAPVSSKSSLSLNLTGLEDLGDDFVYEGWIIVDGAPVSTGIFTVNSTGELSETEFLVDAQMLSEATTFVLSIEPSNDTDPAPAETKILAGDFSGASASVTTDLVGDFSSSTGKYILATPTNDNDMDETSGIWFLDLTMGDPVAGLDLPTLPAGWKYEGWVVRDGTVFTTGKFTATDMADEFSGFSSTMNPGPPFPGEDFLMNAPDGYSFPFGLNGWTAVISIEPEPDNSPAPFTLKPLVGEIPADAMDHTTYDMATNLVFPMGTVSR